MKRIITFSMLCLLAANLAAGDIWSERSPHRKRPSTPTSSSGYGSVAILPRGPQYGPPEAARFTGGEPSINEIQQMVQDQSGASPDGLVSKSTTGQDPCQGNPGLAAMQTQVQDFMAKVNAWIAKVQAFNTEALRLTSGVQSCCTNYANPSCVSCINGWNSQISAHNAQFPALEAEGQSLVAAAMALQGQYMALQSSTPCRSGLTQASPPGQSLGNFARRLGVKVPGGLSSSGSFGSFPSRDFNSMAGMSQGWGDDFKGNFDQGVKMRPFELAEFKLWKINGNSGDFWKVNMRPFELEQGRFSCLQLQAAALERARQSEEAKAKAAKNANQPDKDYHDPIAKKLAKDFDELTPSLSISAVALRDRSLKISEVPPLQTNLASSESDEGKGMWDKAKEAGTVAKEWIKEKAIDKGKEKAEEYADEAAVNYLGESRADALKKIVKTDQNVFERVGQAFDTMGKMVADPAGDWGGLQNKEEGETKGFTGKWSEDLGGPKAGFFGGGS